MADIDDRAQLHLCHRVHGTVRAHMQQMEKEPTDGIDDKNDRCHDFHQNHDDGSVGECHFFRVCGGQRFRCDFTEDQDNDGKDRGHDTDTSIAEKFDRKSGGERSGHVVDQVVADEDRA